MVGHGHFSRALMARWIGLPVVEGALGFMLDAPALGRCSGYYHGRPSLPLLDPHPRQPADSLG